MGLEDINKGFDLMHEARASAAWSSIEDLAMNGAETLVETLIASNVNICFANPGTSEMHFVAALDRHPDMRCVLCLFEGGATGAADGYYRMTERLARRCCTSRPASATALPTCTTPARAKAACSPSWRSRPPSPALRGPLKGDTEGSHGVSHWVRSSADPAHSHATGRGGARGPVAERPDRHPHPARRYRLVRGRSARAAASRPRPAPPLRHRHRRCRPRSPEPRGRAHGRPPRTSWRPCPGRRAHRPGSGCRLIAPYFVARMRRGRARCGWTRLAYRIEDNLRLLSPVTTLVLCGTTRPAGFFAYPGQPSLPENPDGG